MSTEHVLYGPDDKGVYGYRDYRISRCTEAVMSDHYTWEFVHVDYDGAPDAHDHRCGYGETVEDCRAEIDIIEQREEDEEHIEDLKERGITPRNRRESI